MPHLPQYIGICGHPKSGKSLVQEMLHRNFGVMPVDDGLALRKIAMNHFGAKYDDVFTQEGKAKLAHWPNGDPIVDHRSGEHMNWRQVLGRVGTQLEDLFGPYVMPMMACANLDLRRGNSFSFGSVRKTQGNYFKAHGGVIIHVDNPIAKPSGNDFDWFDPDLIDYTIDNDALARGLPHKEAFADLETKIANLCATLLMERAA